MKATELMIGDWVYSLIDRDGKTVKEPQRIKGIWADEYNGKKVLCSLLTDTSDVWYSTGTFEPIPITPEILEKNGFKKDERNERMYTWNWGVIDDCISYDKETGMVHIFYVSGLAFKKILMYVHQLQQAMRLCEINKDIIVEDKE